MPPQTSSGAQSHSAAVDSKTRFVVKRRLVHVLEVEDVNFATDRSVFLPDGHAIAGDPAGPDRITGLRVLAAALDFAQRAPEKRLLIAGHTDSVGSVKHNLELSTDRARNLQLYLAGDRDGWAADCQEHYEVDDYQAILKWIDATFGFDCDPGEVDNVFGDNTREARDRFRQRANEELREELGFELKRHVKQNENDWRAYALLYDRALAADVSADVEDEVTVEDLNALRTAITFTDPAILGCGEHWPVDAIGIDGHECEANRRVDLLFFDEAEVPAIGSGDPPGQSIYGKNRFRSVYLPVELAGLTDLEIQLLDPAGFPMPGTEFRVLDGDAVIGFGHADDDGVASATAFEVSPTVVVEWSRAEDSDDFQFRTTYIVDLDDDPEEADRQRLANLGFDLHDEDTFNVEHFEQFFSLGLTGIFDTISDLLGGWHDDGDRPEPGVNEDGIPESEGDFDLLDDEPRPTCGCRDDDPE